MSFIGFDLHLIEEGCRDGDVVKWQRIAKHFNFTRKDLDRRVGFDMTSRNKSNKVYRMGLLNGTSSVHRTVARILKRIDNIHERGHRFADWT